MVLMLPVANSSEELPVQPRGDELSYNGRPSRSPHYSRLISHTHVIVMRLRRLVGLLNRSLIAQPD